MKVAAKARTGLAENAPRTLPRRPDSANEPAKARTGLAENAPRTLPRMGHEERRQFHKRMVLKLGRSPPVLDLRDELRELGERLGYPVCYPLCDGLVLTVDGVRHGLRRADGRYDENLPLYAAPLNVGLSAKDAEARVRLALDAYGEGDHQWVYPAGRSFEEHVADDFAMNVKIGCFPCFAVFWAVRAAVRQGLRLRQGLRPEKALENPSGRPPQQDSPLPSARAVQTGPVYATPT